MEFQSNAVIYTSDVREELVFLLLIPTVEVADTPDLVAVGSDWDRLVEIGFIKNG